MTSFCQRSAQNTYNHFRSSWHFCQKEAKELNKDPFYTVTALALEINSHYFISFLFWCVNFCFEWDGSVELYLLQCQVDLRFELGTWVGFSPEVLNLRDG